MGQKWAHYGFKHIIKEKAIDDIREYMKALSYKNQRWGIKADIGEN